MGTPSFTPIAGERLPLSLSQREIWLDQHAWPGSVHLNIGGGAFLEGAFDLERFQVSLRRLVAENDALRLAPMADGTQLLLNLVDPKLEIVDLGGSDDPKAAIRNWWRERIGLPFAFDGTPLWRFTLLRAHDRLHGLMIHFHHLIMDGWGTAQVMRRWTQLYNALEADEAPPPTNDPGYRLFIAESNDYRRSEAFIRDGTYWRAQIPALPPPLFDRHHLDAPENELPSARLVAQRISRQDYNRLKQVANDQGASPFVFFLAALALYLARVGNRQTVVIGVPSLNRGGNRYKETLGMFVGVTVLAVTVSPGMTLGELIAAVRTGLRGALRHQRYPLSELGRDLQMIRTGRNSLFDVLLSFERQDYALSFAHAKIVEIRQFFSGVSRYPLGITICEFHPDQDLEMVLEGSSACFEAGEEALLGRRLWHIVRHIVDALVTGGPASVEAVSIVPPEERWALLQGLHKDVACLQEAQPYISLFEHQAALRPEATAVVWDGGSMTYADLDKHAARLARRLVALGAQRDRIIAVTIGRSPDMVVALLAVTKAGAAFLPLDPEAPVARLSGILEESDAMALLIEGHRGDRLGRLHANTVIVDWTDSSSPEAEALPPPVSASPAPGDLAYVLFTSGSTGRPKGVMVEHATLSRRLTWLSRAYAVDWRDRSGQATQLTFDPSLIELLLPLINGAGVALPPPGRLLPESLPGFAVRHGVTIMAFVPATLSRFLDHAGKHPGLKLRVACCGGEVLAPELANRFLSETGATLYNVYGPTETAIFATAWKCDRQPPGRALPIGRPIDDTRIYVLDAQRRLLPFGVPGEIFIGGEAIARGYLNRPDLNREAFWDDPYRPGGRMYRTGDRGWLGGDGNLYFIGRMDRQIKLRGYRIELGEIEAACLTVSGVAHAAAKRVTYRGKPEIHVWVAAVGEIDSQRIQRELRAHLPDYMIPGGISVLSALALNSSGKIDYDALSDPDHSASLTVSRPPGTPLERQLVSLWEAVLNIRPVGVQDNFFDLGGDSLAAVQLLAKIEKRIGKKAPLYLITEHPTIAQLAVALSRESVLPEIMVRLSTETGGVPVYLAASGHGDLLRFQKLAQVLGDVCDLYMLQPPMAETISCVADLAGHYADSIAANGKIPCIIAGFSVGGIAALETARLLRRRGAGVRGLVLIDTIYPKAVLGGITSWRLLGRLVRNLHLQDLSMNGRRLGAMFNDPGLVSQVMALGGYHPSVYDGPTLLIKSSGFAGWDRWFFRSWRRLMTGNLTECQVPGLHGSLFEAGNVGGLAEALAASVSGLPGEAGDALPCRPPR